MNLSNIHLPRELEADDSAERLYRHIEQLMQDHSPRVLGCFLNIDSSILGHLMMGKDWQIKVLMAEHKQAVSELLRAMMPGPVHPDVWVNFPIR